jgi:subtilisin family serine protease
MNQLNKYFLLLFAALLSFNAQSQKVDKKILNWYNGKKFGMHTDLAYKKLLADKKGEAVVVAVIDSGVDIEHEDLQGRIWTNPNEIAGNGIDDDNNGYIDDVHGWNFLGAADGENINDVQLEMTRLYARFKKQFDGRSADQVTDDEQADYTLYKEVEKEVDEVRKESQKELDGISGTWDLLEKADAQLKEKNGGDYTYKDLKKLKKDPDVGIQAQMMIQLDGLGLSFEDFTENKKYLEDDLKFAYNIEVNPREIVGDDPSDFSDIAYGNNDVEGPDAGHGTHCSGIITALRGNGIGNDGVADNARIMSLRAVPNGDERDKDIALAVRYAVDNGAKVISMSFGKEYSPYQEEVIAAFRYAEEKDVLLVHAAGNEGVDVDITTNYPTPKYESMSDRFTNWIEVGASTRYKKVKYKSGYLWHDGLAADFSNYGDDLVDVYAPGLEIYSTVPQSEYDEYAGTSMACPMVSGLAALLKSYFPELKMSDIRKIIVSSVQDVSEISTPLPGDVETTVTFVDLCNTAGIVNTYNAVLMAEDYK